MAQWSKTIDRSRGITCFVMFWPHSVIKNPYMYDQSNAILLESRSIPLWYRRWPGNVLTMEYGKPQRRQMGRARGTRAWAARGKWIITQRSSPQTKAIWILYFGFRSSSLFICSGAHWWKKRTGSPNSIPMLQPKVNLDWHAGSGFKKNGCISVSPVDC